VHIAQTLGFKKVHGSHLSCSNENVTSMNELHNLAGKMVKKLLNTHIYYCMASIQLFPVCFHNQLLQLKHTPLRWHQHHYSVGYTQLIHVSYGIVI
jgi:hypothetical protein